MISAVIVPEAMRVWAAKNGPTAVLAAARARLEAGQRGTRLAVHVELDDAAKREVSELLGLQWRASQAPVTLGLLRNGLRKHGLELEDLLVACAGGPLHDAKAERAAARAARESALSSARARMLEAGVPESVVEQALTRRWLGAPEQLEEITGRLACLWAALPAPAGTLLATFAGDLFDDPHALDKDTLLGRAAARLIAAGRHQQSTEDADSDVAAGVLEAEAWRATWASVGVACDRVSSTVLVLNLPLRLPGDGLGVAPVVLDAQPMTVERLCAAAAGEPLWLTSRMLPSGFRLSSGSCADLVVRVCENPAVVEAAADELGTAAPPLLCTYGRPSLAARALLTALTRAGARLLITADRDAAGNSILSGLLAEFPSAVEWLPDTAGMYEENRLFALLKDMRSAL